MGAKEYEDALGLVLASHMAWANGNGGRRLSLEAADLRGAYLYNADLSNAVLSQADLSYATLVRAVFRRADFTDARCIPHFYEGELGNYTTPVEAIELVRRHNQTVSYE